jgi:DnaJ-class molecular chaperone
LGAKKAMKDIYRVLGVPRTARPEEIKAAYRKLAKELHPDRNPGNPRAAERFKEISAAYDILGDEKKRARFDAGEIDSSGAERRDFHYASRGGRRGGADDPFAAGPGAGFGRDFGVNVEDLFADLFANRRRGGAGQPFRQRGADRSFSIAISFIEAARGGTRRLTLPGADKTLDVNFPPGISDGQKIRLKHQGEPGMGADAGDALIEVKVEPHPFFTRKGNDVHCELPVTLQEAVLGAKINAPTTDGMVALTVPRNSNTGTQLRLKGKGIKDAKTGRRGDQYVILKVMLPEGDDAGLDKFARTLRPGGADVRRGYTVD